MNTIDFFMENKKVPILFLIFNRKETALLSFEPIRLYRPERLYIAADGPRGTVFGEKEKCIETRNAILSRIDWNCKVETMFRDKNLGCTDAVYGGISWFFEQEEYGIINEDDVVLSQDFFLFCEELLPRYKEKDKVMIISSRNHSGLCQESDEYIFSYYANIWGWASWRRAWKYNTNTFVGWREYPKWELIKRFGLFQGLVTIWYYSKCSNPTNNFGSWDYTWSYTINKLNGLCLCPRVNLSCNVGFVIDGSNFQEGDKNPYETLGIGRIKWPLKIHNKIVVDKVQLKNDEKDFFRMRCIGLRKKTRFFKS